MKKFFSVLLTIFTTTSSQAGLDEGLAAAERKNYQMALKEFQSCADQAICQHNLGIMYAQGWGVAKDERKAVELYQEAAEKGYTSSLLNLGLIYEKNKDIKKAIYWHQKAAEQGQLDSYIRLFGIYYEGNGVAKDEVKAAQFMQKAADKGSLSAQSLLGGIYEHGIGVGKDERKAFEWYQKAAEQGELAALYNLGLMYANGKGVSKDEGKAIELLQRAAELGNPMAQTQLGYMYSEGLGVTQSWASAIYWVAKAAQQGEQQAINNLIKDSHKRHLRQLTINSISVPLLNKSSIKSEAIASLSRDTAVFKLKEENGFTQVYIPEGYKVGFVQSIYLR